MDELRAIAQLKKGDMRGLEVLVRKYQLEAVRIAFSIVKDKGSAEEIVQDAFIRVYRRIDQYDDSRAFRPWFIRIVVNDSLKRVQHQKRLIPLDDALESGGGSTDADLLNQKLCVEQDEFSAIHDDFETLHEILSQLSFEHCTVLQLKYYLEFKDEEIAEILEIPAGTVKSRLHAAKRNLRCLLAQLDCVSWDR